MKIKAVAGAMLFVAVFACASEKRTPARAPVAAPPATTSSQQADAPQTLSDIRIADEIKRACGISEADAHFAFDSSLVRDVDYPILRKLVACFASGPLAKREMRLVGHADPRGDDEYNLVLGGSRADGVKGFLIQGGLSQAQVATSSRGEVDSKGVDEASWSNDRRVDILLAN